MGISFRFAFLILIFYNFYRNKNCRRIDFHGNSIFYLIIENHQISSGTIPSQVIG